MGVPTTPLNNTKFLSLAGDAGSWPYQSASQETQEDSRHHTSVPQYRLVFVQLHLEVDGWRCIGFKPDEDDSGVD